MGMGAKSRSSNKMEGVFGKGALAGKTGLIVEAAKAAGIDPNLFAAVIAHETGFGTSNAIKNYNNPAGIMDPKTKWTKLKKFETLADGLEYSAKNLKRRIDQAGGDMAKLASIYAPVGANNDPTNLNANWLGGVNKIYTSLGTTEKPVAIPASNNTLLAR